MAGVSPSPRWGWAVVGGAFLQAGLVFGGLRALGLCLGALGGSFGAQAGAVAWVGSAAIASLQLGGGWGTGGALGGGGENWGCWGHWGNIRGVGGT